jgi:hypothetical protein
MCSARSPTGQPVAIKKIYNAFANSADALRTLHEVSLLQQLCHPNIVNLLDVMEPIGPTFRDFKDIYLVYELMDSDLHKILASKQPLSDHHFRYFTYQVRAFNVSGSRRTSPGCKGKVPTFWDSHQSTPAAPGWFCTPAASFRWAQPSTEAEPWLTFLRCHRSFEG